VTGQRGRYITHNIMFNKNLFLPQGCKIIR
jgi:hypothetical protein